MSLFGEVTGSQSKAPDSSFRALRAEICAHLSRICAIRRGSLPLAPSYGVRDVTLLFYGGALGEWCSETAKVIEHYEPRLRRVTVVPLDPREDDLLIRAEIRALLIHEGQLVPVHFTAVIDGHHSSKVL